MRLCAALVSGAEFYRNSEACYLGEITTNEHLPFTAGDYQIRWQDHSVTVSYVYSAKTRPPIWRAVTFDFSA